MTSAETPTVRLFSRTIPSDDLTPILAYRRLVTADERDAPSFLLESVEVGGVVGRWSYLGAAPRQMVEAALGGPPPWNSIRDRSCLLTSTDDPDAPPFRGGWVGWTAYESAVWSEPTAIQPNPDQLGLAFGLYFDTVAFDHVRKLVHLQHLAEERESDADAEAALDLLEKAIRQPVSSIPGGRVPKNLNARPQIDEGGAFPRDVFESAVQKAQKYISAGDAFQIVLSRCVEKTTEVDPFEMYRALRITNPSPYMGYLQGGGVMLVAASPEILCQARGQHVINRPLAGTRRRGATPAEDLANEVELRGDPKENAEHAMLVDLGRNDLGRVCVPGSVRVTKQAEVERFSHVMHLSSTVEGTLRQELDAWDLLAATLPVGTVSGAPKIRAMQIIDELEPHPRGPFAGGFGVIGLDGDADMAIALRTMVISADGPPWRVRLQAGAGVVADSVPSAEFEETRSKSAAAARAVEVAESMFNLTHQRP
ncbi:MAG: anthranilate synthase component I [Phycisphaerae bacterium]|nr:anthranilate synthase component I [Phycisphaerae bacterium]